MYLLDMSGIEQTLAMRAVQMGQPLPERIANAPELKLGLQLYLQSFLDLNSERLEGAIPWSSISNYAKAFEFDDEQTASLFYLVRKLDTLYLDRRAEKAKKANG